ncbi:hypothetical protein GGR92_005249 [Spirosoma lacussanchae]|uniref:hypothetical protein n=1 Tax=Spirosoma lacussanchae TaxID=1884249 RepID=UPI001108845D|nr:hypothetical protein [Spirosoma lacussanchae]
MEQNQPKHFAPKVGEVFVTNFWGVREVCMVESIKDGLALIIRLESAIYKRDPVRACFDQDEIQLLRYEVLHKTQWNG